ncbi:MBL fold metallo-hydrolase [Leucobacter viscericola]|uniref:MBL fold metallo-hydrolase n=1 Tax=Leucobacter viscericola TaxID=2714935 RepID=A0A6G7XH23_9MICO|nr:MBL fold metallo-hydrolase [Leucobacter viscericola]QIK63865.1 MBL fold metallo-hydrolase [Leucobacter viscericola]
MSKAAEPSHKLPTARPLDLHWIHGSESAKHNTDPDLQTYWYDESTVILRQNKATNYEAPFLYLLFGSEKAMLVDTGATADPAFLPLRETVDQLLESWCEKHPSEGYELLVLHSHEHGDHIAGDQQFQGRANTTVVGADRTSAWSFLGFNGNALKPQNIDLGDRTVLAIASPGHDAAAVTYYDSQTGILLTGDTVYRGRLYIEDWAAFTDTIDRLIRFAEEYPVTHVLGCHIEMTREPGVDYPVRTTYQPDEPPLEMTVAHLHQIRDALTKAGSTPKRVICDDFILWPKPGDND